MASLSFLESGKSPTVADMQPAGYCRLLFKLPTIIILLLALIKQPGYMLMKVKLYYGT